MGVIIGLCCKNDSCMIEVERTNTKILCNAKLPRWLTVKMYKTVIQLISLYIVELVAVKQENIRFLKAIEMKIFR